MQILEKRDIPRMIDRLKALGYANRKRVRMYGEVLELVSDPVPEADGFVIDAKSGGKGAAGEDSGVYCGNGQVSGTLGEDCLAVMVRAGMLN